MTLRTYLARRARFVAIFFWTVIILVFAVPRGMPLPGSASTTIMALLGVGLVASAWLATFAVCQRRLGAPPFSFPFSCSPC
jgi:hypothetical protein